MILWRNMENYPFVIILIPTPDFPLFLLYVRWKSGVTFVRRCFRDVKPRPCNCLNSLRIFIRYNRRRSSIFIHEQTYFLQIIWFLSSVVIFNVPFILILFAHIYGAENVFPLFVLNHRRGASSLSVANI